MYITLQCTNELDKSITNYCCGEIPLTKPNLMIPYIVFHPFLLKAYLMHVPNKIELNKILQNLPNGTCITNDQKSATKPNAVGEERKPRHWYLKTTRRRRGRRNSSPKLPVTVTTGRNKSRPSSLMGRNETHQLKGFVELQHPILPVGYPNKYIKQQKQTD